MKEKLRKIIESAIEAMKDDSVAVIIKKVDSGYEFEPYKEDVGEQENEVWRLYSNWQETILYNKDYRGIMSEHEFCVLMSELWQIERHKTISDSDTEDFAYFVRDNEYQCFRKENLELIGINFDDRCVDILVDEIMQTEIYKQIIGI